MSQIGIGIAVTPVIQPIAGTNGMFAYLLRDEFTTALAAGSVNGTAAEPGPGTRVVTDTENKLSISSGQLSISGGKAIPGHGDPAIWYGSVTRIAGRTLIQQLNMAAFLSSYIGFDDDQLSFAGRAQNIVGPGVRTVPGSTIFAAPLSVSTDYILATVLKSIGSYLFLKGGVFTNWTLGYIDPSGAEASLFPAYTLFDDTVTSDYIRIPNTIFLPTPLAYDTFTRADSSTIGNTETTGPDGQTTPQKTWVEDSGDWEISSNTLIAVGLGIATINASGNGDYFISVDITTPGAGTTPAGLIVRFSDTSNYWYIKMTPGTVGTDFELVEVNAGVPTTRASSDEDFAAATQFNIKVAVEGDDEWRVFLDDVVAFTFTTTNSFNQNATEIGFRDEGNSNFIFDDLLVFGRGTNNEYQQLDAF